MKEQFVTYEIAKRLKELGFNKPCLAHWATGTMEFKYMASIDGWDANSTGFVSAPLWQQAIDWLREEHNIEIYCQNYYRGAKNYKPEYEIRINGSQEIVQHSASSGVILYSTYEQAREAAILKALELIK